MSACIIFIYIYICIMYQLSLHDNTRCKEFKKNIRTKNLTNLKVVNVGTIRRTVYQTCTHNLNNLTFSIRIFMDQTISFSLSWIFLYIALRNVCTYLRVWTMTQSCSYILYLLIFEYTHIVTGQKTNLSCSCSFRRFVMDISGPAVLKCCCSIC